jgi:hypothetical protein
MMPFSSVLILTTRSLPRLQLEVAMHAMERAGGLPPPSGGAGDATRVKAV